MRKACQWCLRVIDRVQHTQYQLLGNFNLIITYRGERLAIV
jgi:hypothetical protein